MFRFYRFCATALLSVVFTLPATAAYISEVYIAGGPYAQPNAIEISGLSSLAGGLDTVQLVLVDARNATRYGAVRQVVNIPLDGHDTVLISDAAWPDGLYACADKTRQVFNITLDALLGGVGETWNFDKARSIFLFSGETTLLVGPDYRAAGAAYIETLKLDVVTLEFTATARAYGDEPVELIKAGEVYTRPLSAQTFDPLSPLVAMPGGSGLLTLAAAQSYAVTPGTRNDILGVVTPEPATVLLVTLGTLCVARRPHRI